ncbi:CSRNP [Mytilus edulis]|uniref:CSRNP n=1 Tax=Mytilus edulis TaxID=6550 RepID=A0A8S3RLR4_MYTED|nr:CSRNP [Mytilus edulis]
MDIDIAGPIIDAIVKKQSVILKLDEQILENTSDEDIEVEITDADEYNLDLETNLRRYKKLAQTVTRTCTELSHESIPNTRPVMNMHEVNSETRPVMNTEFIPRFSEVQQFSETASYNVLRIALYSELQNTFSKQEIPTFRGRRDSKCFTRVETERTANYFYE